MSEHFTRNTLEATAWCRKCQRTTLHRIDDGRTGPCLEHDSQQLTREQIARDTRAKRNFQQRKLFEETQP